MDQNSDATNKPAGASGADVAALLLVSFLALFFELALIRWIPANVLSIAYFSNIVLISCFLGFGLGCLLGGRDGTRRDLFDLFPPLLLLAALAFIYFRFVEVVVPVREGEWVWSGYRISERLGLSRLKLGVVPALVVIFSLNVIVFIPLGQLLGRLMEKFRPVRAYAINILGSLLGVAAFAALSYAGAPPVVWFLAGSAVTLWFFRGRRAWLALCAVALILLCLLVWQSSRRQIWSPYYSLQEQPRENGEFILYVNHFLHQRALNFETHERARELYGLPYRLATPRRLLVLGAGTGNDVAAAQFHGAREIDAVEIDPVIVDIGRARHPNRPYARPGVSIIVDDARSVLRRTQQQYDMIVFGTLDSQALLSGKSTVRLENFVYTRECLDDVRRRLTDDGIVVLMFSVPMRWIGDKLIRLTTSIFPNARYIYNEKGGFLFNLMILAGPGLDAKLAAHPEIAAQLTAAPPYGKRPAVDVPVDDWPYLYLRERAIPEYYLRTLAVLTVISLLAVLLVLPNGGRVSAHGAPSAAASGRGRVIDPQFFALGAAFMLLETKSVTTLSLLFGSTWTVNVFVFGSILLMIFLANMLVLKHDIRRLGMVYLCLGVSLLVNYLIPPAVFLALGAPLQFIAPALLTALPLFFAGIIFAALFKRVTHPAAAFGANLLGAVLGGCLEYASMAVGMNNLHLIAAALYIASFVLFMKNHRAA